MLFFMFNEICKEIFRKEDSFERTFEQSDLERE
jgi:hypothetical protein